MNRRKRRNKVITSLLTLAMVLGMFTGITLGTDAPTAVAAGATDIVNLRVNNQVDPVGIDREAVRFGWQMESNIVGQHQLSYRIVLHRIVVGAPNVQVWDSGVVSGRQAQGVHLPDTVTLNPETRYEWRVTVTPYQGAAITSDPAWFLTGADWSDTQWIMPRKCSINNETYRMAGNTWVAPNVATARTLVQELYGFALPSNVATNFDGNPHGDFVRLGGNPLMRTLGEIPDDRGAIAFAALYMTALGDYIPYINGEKVLIADPAGNLVEPMFAPGFTDFNSFINYQTFDVTHMLEAGEEFVLGALVNKGAYAGRVGANYYGSLGRFPAVQRDVEHRNNDPSSNWNARRGTGNAGGPLISPLTRFVPFTDNPSRTLGLRAQLVVTFADGTTETFGRNASDWYTIAGPAVFNDYFNGEILCGNRAKLLEDWSTVDFDTTGWYRAVGGPCSVIDVRDQVTGRDYPYNNSTVDDLTWISYPKSQLRPNNTAVSRFADEYDVHPIDGFMVRSTTAYGTARPRAAEVIDKGPYEGRPSFIRGQAVRHPVDITGLENGSGTVVLRPGERIIVELGRLGAEYDWRYNRGQNMVGVLELELSGTPRTSVRVRHAELLSDGSGGHGNAQSDAAWMLYYDAMRGNQNQVSFMTLCDAGTRQTWRPLTTYNGFQFAEISVDTNDPDAQVILHGVTGKVITSAHNRVSELSVDGVGEYPQLVRQLHENILWGMMGNWITIPIDCPQRPERVGWAGDAQIFAQTAVMSFDTIEFYENYMQIMNANVERFNTFGQVMPGGWSGNNQNQGVHSGWSDAGIVIPKAMFLHSGNLHMLELGWDQKNLYMDRVWGADAATWGTANPVGGGPGTFAPVEWWVSGSMTMMIERINAYDSVQFYGDWLGFGAAHLLYMNAVYQIYSTVLMMEKAEILGDTNRYNIYSARYEILRDNFLRDAQIAEVPVHVGAWGERGNNPLGRVRTGGGFIYNAEDAERFGMLEGDLMTFGPVRNNFIPNLGDNAQTGLIWALRLGLYRDEDHRQHLVNRLDEHVRNEGGAIRPGIPENTLSVGFLGVNVLLPFMSDVGLNDTALDLFLNDDLPTWLYPIRSGATTMWERWDSFSLTHGFGAANMNSFNHFAYGAVGEWMYTYLAGIKPGADGAGFKDFTLQPMLDRAGRLDDVRLSFDSVYGTILSHWETEDGFLSRYEAIVPANTTTTLYLPAVFETEAEFRRLHPNMVGATFVGPTTHNGQLVTQFELVAGRYVFNPEIPNVNTIFFTNDTPHLLARMQVGIDAPVTTVPNRLRVPVGESVTFTLLPGLDPAMYGFEMWTQGVPQEFRYNPTITLTPTADMNINFRLSSTYSDLTLTINRGVLLNSETAPDPAAFISIDGAAPGALGATPIVRTFRILEGQEYVDISVEASVQNFVDFSFATWSGDIESGDALLNIRLDRDMEIYANFNWNGFYSLSSLVNNPVVTIMASGQANATNWAVANLAHGNITNIPGRLGWSAPALGAQVPANPAWVSVNLSDEYAINRVHLYPRMCSIAAPGVPPNFPVHFTLEYATDVLDYPTGVTNAQWTAQINALNWQPVVGAVIAANGTRIEAVGGRFEIAPEDVPFMRPLVVMLDEAVDARHVRLVGHRINAPEAGTTAWHMQLVHFGIYEPSADDLIRSELRALLAEAAPLNHTNFSAANWRLFAAARNNAQNIYNDTDSTSVDIINVINTLRNLVERRFP